MKLLLAIGCLYAVLLTTGFWSMWPTPDDCTGGNGTSYRVVPTSDPKLVRFEYCE